MNGDPAPLPLTPPDTAADWFAACVEDLNRDVPPVTTTGDFSDKAADLFGVPGACLNAAQLFPALAWIAHGAIDSESTTFLGKHGSGLLQRLFAQWLDVHAFVLAQGVQEDEITDLLEGDPSEAARGIDWTGADLEAVLGTAERGWDLLFDATYSTTLQSLTRGQLAEPDYRSRLPTAYWTFDSADVDVPTRHIADVAGSHHLDLVGSGSMAIVDGALVLTGVVEDSVDAEELGIAGDVTVSFWIDPSSLSTGYNYILNYYSGLRVYVYKYSSGDWMIGVGHDGAFSWTPLESTNRWAHVAVVRKNRRYSVYKDGVIWDWYEFTSDPYYDEAQPVQLFSYSSYGTTGTLVIDELAIWDYALSSHDIGELAAASPIGSYPAEGTRPASGPFGKLWMPGTPSYVGDDPNHEQGIGLPVKILETAAQHARAVEAFADEQLRSVYETCYRGSSSAAQARALATSSRSLRYIFAAESFARKLAGNARVIPCTGDVECVQAGAAACSADLCVDGVGDTFYAETPWDERYQGAQSELSAARGSAIDALRRLRNCENPLGIAEDDLPLYFGDVGGTNARFFASSDYLMDSWARPAVSTAIAGLEASRTAWISQRNSQIQQLMTEHDAGRRLEALELRYMEPVIAACGISDIPALDVLEAFESDDLYPWDCYRESGCAGGGCLRGTIGDATLAMHSAVRALKTEKGELKRRAEEFEQQRATCEFTERSLYGDLAAMAVYNERAKKLRNVARNGIFGSVIGALSHFAGKIDPTLGAAVDAAFSDLIVDVLKGCIGGRASTAGQPGGSSSAAAGAGCLMGFIGSDLGAANQLAALRDNLDLALAAGSAARELRGCWDLLQSRQRDAIFQADHILQRHADLRLASFRVEEGVRDVARRVSEARPALDRELNRTAPSIAHHYWLDEKIDRFRIDFERARRYVYLAMRASEYELQQSFGLRGAILTASHPNDLLDVVNLLDVHRGTRTINGARPEDNIEVLSLRTDILGLGDLIAPKEGERTEEATRRLQQIVMSNEYSMRDRAGNYLGQAIPFSLEESGALKHRCAERLWRVTATIQGDLTSVDEPGTNVFLMKANVFQSQWCTGLEPYDGAPYQQASTASVANLFLEGDSSDAPASEYTVSLMYPWFNVRRSEFFRDEYMEGASEELAGRGLYGDYVLLFPYNGMLEPDRDCESSGDERCQDIFRDLRRVEDVLIRFDYYSVDDLPLP